MQNTFLFAADYSNYFNVESTRGIELIVALSLIGAIIIAGLAIYFLKKDFFKKYLIIAGATLVAFAISIAIANVVLDFQGEETYTESYQVTIVCVLAAFVVVLGALAFFLDAKTNIGKKNNTQSIVYAAVCIALAFGLSYIRMFKAPYGGSITLASLLPIALYSYIFGVKKGTLCGVIYGVLQSIQDPWIVHPVQYFIDYAFAFGMIGLFGGMFRNVIKNKMLALTLGLVVGSLGRYLMHVLSGAIYFGEYMPEDFTNVWVYSFTYNALYVFPDIAISIAVGVLLLTSKTIQHQLDQIMNPVDKTKVIDAQGNLVSDNANNV